MNAPAPLAGSTRHHGRGSRRALKVAIMALFIGAIGAFFAFDGPRYLQLDEIKQHHDELLTLAYSPPDMAHGS